VLIHLYLDIFDRASHRSAEIDRILDYGDGLISGKYPFNRRYGADYNVPRKTNHLIEHSYII
jgi:hypothetical protein